MENNRLAILQQMLDQDPENSFSRYGLAMEHVRSNDLEGAAAQFEELQRRNPDHAASYFHGGQTLEKLGRLDDARNMYAKGIQVTTRTGDAHTRSELQAAMDILG